MKKIVVCLIVYFIFILGIEAKSISVKFSSCVDGDTAKFIYKDEVITARFLAIDTPETKHPQKGEQPFGKEASEYTCERLKNAKKIRLEFDSGSDEKDKYDRYLVWVFIDDELLQKELVSKGLASVAYLYGDYKYTDELEAVEQEAEDNKLGIWSISEEERTKSIDEVADLTDAANKVNKEDIDYKEIVIIVGVIILLCLFSSKSRKKVKSEIKKELKKEIKNKLK